MKTIFDCISLQDCRRIWHDNRRYMLSGHERFRWALVRHLLQIQLDAVSAERDELRRHLDETTGKP